MSFLICPRWRKPRSVSPVLPSGGATSRPPAHPVEAQMQPQGLLRQMKDASLQDQKPPESFSHKLRRRFSRESKSPSEHRESGRSIFSFTLRPSRSIVPKSGTELAAVDVGSSLMSERGYDSDAQFISTPNRADHLGRSPASRAMHRMELSDLIEQSHERSEAERWAANGDPNPAESHESAFGMRFIPTPNGTQRGAPSSFHTPQDTHDSRGHTVEGERARGVPGNTLTYVRSAPSLSSTNEGELSPIMNVPDGSHEDTLMSDWKKFLRASRQRYGMASSGSLPPPSPDLVVAKTRQPSHSGRSFTDPRSIHLSDMGISNQLASESITSGSLPFSPSIDELVRMNTHGTFTASSQGRIQSRQVSEASAASQSGPWSHIAHPRDPSSFYSRQSSAHPANPSSDTQSLKRSEDKPSNSNVKPKLGKSSNHVISNDIPPPDNGVLSRFREHCDSGSLPLRAKSRVNGINTSGSPRQVSVGWMSGGRRIGYGYSVVGNTEGEHKQDHDSRPHPSQTSGFKAEVLMMDSDGANDPLHPQEHGVHSAETKVASTPNHNDTQSAPGHASLCTSGAATLPKPENSDEPASNYYPVPAFLQTVLGNHSNRYEKLKTDEKGINTPRAQNTSSTVQNGHCQVDQSPRHSSITNATFSRPWARLSRSVNAQPRAQKSKNDGRKTWTIGPPHPTKESAIAVSIDSLEDAEYHDARNDSENEDRSQGVQSHTSRAARWVQKFSMSRESRQFSSVHQQDPSQTSSSVYEECDSSSINRSLSIKKPALEDRLEIPGSFEGSRWASRISRMF